MPRREFQFPEGNPSKFWTIKWQGATYTVHFGSIGTKGQSQTKILSSANAASAFCEKIIAEKVKKGYVEITRADNEVEPDKPLESAQASVPDILDAPPSSDTPSAAPDKAVLFEVLQLLEAPAEALANFPTHPEDLAWSVSEALTGAPSAILTDWRFSPADVLNDVWQRIYPFQVKGMIEEEDDGNGFPKKILLQSGVVGARYRVRIKGDEPCLHDILFALEKVLPAELRIYALLPYEGTDSYLHVVHSRPIWLQIHERLGSWFWKVFTRHQTALSFTKIGGDVKPKQNRVKKELNSYLEWLKREEEPHQRIPQQIRAVLEINVNDPNLRPKHAFTVPEEKRKRDLEKWLEEMTTPRRFCRILGDMDHWGNRIMTEGVVRVLQNQDQGWQRIHLALQYHFLDARFRVQLHPNGKIDFVVDDGGRIMALAWALGDLRIVDWLGMDLLQNPHHFTGWGHNPLEPFLLQLYAVWKGIDVNWANYPKAKLGVYQQIFKSWNNPAKLSGALDICCDYHLMRTGESGYQEFCWHPYEIFPVEILAVYRARELLNLETPAIPHQLMDSPLGKLPEPVWSAPDELLQNILDVVEKEWPEIWQEVKAIIVTSD